MGQSPSSPEIRTFHDYRLKSFLGSGSFGVVWELEGWKKRALKVILVDPQNEERQKRELDISLQVNHGNLVEVFSVERKETTAADLGDLVPVEDDKCASIVFQLRREKTFEVFCLTLELCGETLRKWLKEEHNASSSISTTCLIQFTIVKNIIEGLKYLHSKRIIHRDLKPENIMFSTKGYFLPVKIGDYGTCRVLKDPQTSTLTSDVGTDLYRAPESSSNSYSFQSDLFSLGLIMWEVLQLLPLQNLRNHFDRLVNDRDKRVVQLSPRFQNFRDHVIKLCDKNVQNRLKNLDQIELNACNFGKEFVAKNSAEFELILQNCEDGWTIRLVEGVYKGEFVIMKRGVTLIGLSKEKTILRGAQSDVHPLKVVGADFKALNLKVDGTGRLMMWGSGISIEANNCTLEGIIVSNLPHFGRGVATKHSLNTKINNVHFEDVSSPISVDGGNCNISGVTINNCMDGIELKNVDNSLIQSVFITNAKFRGIGISASKKIHLQNVHISGMTNRVPPMAGGYPPCGILIFSCPEGDFELGKVTCSGFIGEDEAGLFISKKSLSAKVTVIACSIGKVVKDTQGKYCK